MANEISPTRLYEDQGFTVSTWKNVFFLAWGRQATVELVNKAWALTETFVKAHPEGCSCVHITFDGVPLADAAGRDRFRKFSEAFADKAAAVACIVPGTGFWASALRSFITGVLRFERRRFKVLICKSIEEAADWLPAPHAERTGVMLQGRELARVLGAISKPAATRSPARASP